MMAIEKNDHKCPEKLTPDWNMKMIPEEMSYDWITGKK